MCDLLPAAARVPPLAVIILGATFINSQRVKTVYFVAAAVTFVAMDILFKPYQVRGQRSGAAACRVQLVYTGCTQDSSRFF
jgi:hypothetical protein